MSRRGAALFALMSLVWGVPYLLIKVAVEGLEPAALVFVRVVVGLAVLLPFALRAGAVPAALRRWPVVLLYALVETTVPWWLLTTAETRVSSSLAGLAVAGTPLVAALLAWTTTRERLGAVRLLGLLLGLAGVAALLGLDLAGGADPVAVLQLVGVVLCYAVGSLLIARRLGAVPAIGVNAVALAVTAVLLAPFALPQLPSSPPAVPVVAAVLALGVVCTAGALLAFFALIAEVGAARAVVITYVNPAVAVVLGVLLLDEPLTAGILVGFPLVLLGSVLATRPSSSGAGPVPPGDAGPVPAPSARAA